MKKYDVGLLVFLIMALTISIVIITIIIGMAISKVPTTEINAALREKLLDMIDMIAGVIMGVLSTLLAQKKDS